MSVGAIDWGQRNWITHKQKLLNLLSSLEDHLLATGKENLTSILTILSRNVDLAGGSLLDALDEGPLLGLRLLDISVWDLQRVLDSSLLLGVCSLHLWRERSRSIGDGESKIGSMVLSTHFVCWELCLVWGLCWLCLWRLEVMLEWLWSMVFGILSRSSRCTEGRKVLRRRDICILNRNFGATLASGKREFCYRRWVKLCRRR